jgi:hypothetical protein
MGGKGAGRGIDFDRVVCKERGKFKNKLPLDPVREARGKLELGEMIYSFAGLTSAYNSHLSGL